MQAYITLTAVIKQINLLEAKLGGTTWNYDQEVDAEALSEVMKDVYAMTGNKSVFVTHSQGGAVGWNVDMDYVSAIVAVEPGGTPEVGSGQYQKLLKANVPIMILFGDYIDNGPSDIQSTDFWKSVRDGAVGFAESYHAAGGDCTVINLPDIGITGNSHFMFQEQNNGLIADYIAAWSFWLPEVLGIIRRRDSRLRSDRF